MNSIPNLAPLVTQPFQPSINAEVQKAGGGVHFKVQTNPVEIKTVVVPHELMIQAVALWMQENPIEGDQIVQALKKKRAAELDIIHTVNRTKNI